MTDSRIMPLHEHTREEAVAWLIAFSEGEVTGSACGRFEDWLKASPENVRAYLQVSAFWEAAGNLNQARKAEMDELVHQAAAESNVVSFAGSASSTNQNAAAPQPRRLLPLALAAGVLAVSAIGALVWWQVTRPLVYESGVGEQRTVTLADGSMVELNARSRMAVRFTEQERRVELSEGQALFHVAKNAARPFVVQSGDARVRAVGTEFDVDRKDSGTVVTVVEGKVAVFGAEPEHDADSARGADSISSGPGAAASESFPHAVLLTAGDQVTVSPKAVTSLVHANPEVATAWTRGKLIFDSTPLADVVQAFNRYNAKTLSIDDPKLLTLHVSGTFSTTDSEQMVRFLAQRFGLTVHESSDAIRLSHE